MRRLSLFFIAVFALCGLAAFAQSTGQLAASLEKHAVVLRNYYIDDRLNFDADGKLISRGTPGFGPTDGRVYVEKVELKPKPMTLIGVRPTFFWNSAASEFRLTNVGRKVQVKIKLPDGQPADQVMSSLLTQVFLKQSELQQIKCADGDLKIHDQVPKQEASQGPPSMSDAQSLSELQMLCFPGGERAYRIGRGVLPPKPIRTPDPDYPEAARHAGKTQAAVLLTLIVDANGRPSTIAVARPASFGFDENALSAIMGWSFQPSTFHGQQVPVGINVELNFRFVR